MDGQSYYVHYNGWNTRYDEWIDSTRVVEKVTTPSKGVSRPPYARVIIYYYYYYYYYYYR